jgi:phosphoribosylformylglycinamidine synthase
MTVQPSEELKQLPVTRFVVSPRQADDPRSQGYLVDAHALGVSLWSGLLCQDLYFIEGQVCLPTFERIAQESSATPLRSMRSGCFIDSQPAERQPGEWLVEGRCARRPTRLPSRRRAPPALVSKAWNALTGLRCDTGGAATEADVRQLTRRLLANHVIHRYTVGEIEPAFPLLAQASGQVETISLGELDEEGLLALSNQRRAALDLVEMQAIQNYYQAEGREPSDVEFETIAQTWSEHCVHKTFKARITIKAQPSGQTERVGRAKISNLLNTFIRAATDQIAAPWVRSAFVDTRHH